jgi:FlgD Ig-like domain
MTGEVLWSRRYARAGSSHETLYAIAADSQGNALITGRFSVNESDDDMVVIKFNAVDGEVEWVESFDGGDQGIDRSWAIAVGPDDNPVITGIIAHGDDSASYFTRKLSGNNGDEIWTRIIPGAVNSAFERAGWLEVTDNGDMVMMNRTWSTTSSYDVVLYRFAALNGATVWDTQYNAGGTSPDNPMNMTQDLDGNLIVVGVGSGDYMVLKFDVGNGDLLWSGSYDGPPGWYDTAKTVTIGPDGEVIAGGFSDGSGTSWDMATVAFDPQTGDELWDLRHDGAANQSDEANALAVSDDGDLYIVGYTTNSVSGSDLCCQRFSMYEFSAAQPIRSTPSVLMATPNPFGASVSLSFTLDETEPTRLSIFTVDGRLVSTLFDEVRSPGDVTYTWPGNDKSGNPMPSGIYYARLQRPRGTESRRLILTR